MNRRELIGGITAAFAGIGTVKAIDPEPLPLALVVELDVGVSKQGMENIREQVRRVMAGHGIKLPVFVCQPGMSMKAIVDPRETA